MILKGSKYKRNLKTNAYLKSGILSVFFYSLAIISNSKLKLIHIFAKNFANESNITFINF